MNNRNDVIGRTKTRPWPAVSASAQSGGGISPANLESRRWKWPVQAVPAVAGSASQAQAARRRRRGTNAAAARENGADRACAAARKSPQRAPAQS